MVALIRVAVCIDEDANVVVGLKQASKRNVCFTGWRHFAEVAFDFDRSCAALAVTRLREDEERDDDTHGAGAAICNFEIRILSSGMLHNRDLDLG